MKKFSNSFIWLGIISIVCGILVKLLWYNGIITFLPLGMKPISYVVFAVAMFSLSAAISLIKMSIKE